MMLVLVEFCESVQATHIDEMLLACCVRWAVLSGSESCAKRAHVVSACCMSVGTERSNILDERYSVRVCALVSRTPAFACALINIIQTLVACQITRKRQLNFSEK